MIHYKFLSINTKPMPDLKDRPSSEVVCVVPKEQNYTDQFKKQALFAIGRLRLMSKAIPKPLSSICSYSFRAVLPEKGAYAETKPDLKMSTGYGAMNIVDTSQKHTETAPLFSVSTAIRYFCCCCSKETVSKETVSKEAALDWKALDIQKMAPDLERNRLTMYENVSLNKFTLKLLKDQDVLRLKRYSQEEIATYRTLNKRLKNKVGDDPMVPMLVYPVYHHRLENLLLNAIPGAWKVRFRHGIGGGPGTINCLYIPRSKVPIFKTLHTHLPKDYTTHEVQKDDSIVSIQKNPYHNKNEFPFSIFSGCVVLSHSSY